ncbi:MAG TPA: pilus assembly PilX N-terminal domain-containing protein [Elusimicrobiota bacterium]|nr:pilus assembly PilX N-terminal domain-containing protein [Elusimicrobiota bacterium]
MSIRNKESGFTLVMAIIVMLVLAIMVPTVIKLVRQEAKETVKVTRSSTAFHLAEAGIDQGIWKLQESIDMWNSVKAGGTVEGYNGDTQFATSFASGRGGNYTIRYTAGPGSDEVTILAKGRDSSSQELRAIQCVMTESGAGEFAIQAKNTSSFGAATNVELGPVIARTSIDSGSKSHPRFMSAGNISPNDTSTPASADPNTDGIQWWSFKQDLPPLPLIDTEYYRVLAEGYGTSADPQCGDYKKTGNFTFKGCKDGGGKVFYVTGDVDFQSGSGGNYIVGDVICLGNFGITGNGGADGPSTTIPVGETAWKEYGNDWAFYKAAYDPTCPHATYASAVTANYEPTGLTKTLSGWLIHGFIYTGGSQGLTGGGNAILIGSLYSANNTSMSTSNCTLYYDPGTSSTIHTTNVIISRKSWKEVTGQSWP